MTFEDGPMRLLVNRADVVLCEYDGWNGLCGVEREKLN
jgi:hypothetical protein